MKIFREYLLEHDLDFEIAFIERYINANLVESKWKDSFQEGTLMRQDELNCFYSDNEFPCERYLKKYPNGSGFLFFTRPAIFENNTVIVEYLRNPCSGLAGVFVMLEFEDGNWVVKKSFTTIVS